MQRSFHRLITLGIVLIVLSTITVFAGRTTEDSIIGLWGYKNNIRLCKNANELFQAYIDVNKIPELKQAVDSAEDKNFTLSISFPEQIEFIAPISDKIWLFPKWTRKNPLVKSCVQNNLLIISHTFTGKEIKAVNGRYGFGFMVKTVECGSASEVNVTLSSDNTFSKIKTYNLELLPPIKGVRPEKLLVQLAYYPQFTKDLLKKTFAENTINAGFNDLLVCHGGSSWNDMQDIKMMRKSGMRIIANLFTSRIFEDFPFDKYSEWNETDKTGKIRMRHRDLDMQRIINKEPIIIDYLESYFSNLKNSYDIDGIQVDEERSPLGGFTKEGIKAFREWAGFRSEVKLDVDSINKDYLEMWISFRNRQVAKTFDVIQSAFYKSCGKMPMGYYGAPQVDFGKNYSWAHKNYVACWYLLQGRADWGGAGYDFSMSTMRNTYDRFGKGRFLPWYMVTENYGEKWRRYRKISASLVQHLIASGMNGFSIWYYILDNGSFYDIAQVNNMLSEHEDVLVNGVENSALLALETILPGDMTKTVYSKNNEHTAILANVTKEILLSSFFWRGCDKQPETTLRLADGTTSIIETGKELSIPANSFVTLTSSYNADAVNPFEIEEAVPFKAVFSKAGEKIFFLKDNPTVLNCNISAQVTVETDSEDFGELGIVVRDSGNEKILGGIVLANGAVWARARDIASKEDNKSTGSNYLRNGTSLKKQKIVLQTYDDKTTLTIGTKKYRYNTKVIKGGKIGFFIKANAPGRCVVENFKVVKSKLKIGVNIPSSRKERGKRELRKGAPQV